MKNPYMLKNVNPDLDDDQFDPTLDDIGQMLSDIDEMIGDTDDDPDDDFTIFNDYLTEEDTEECMSADISSMSREELIVLVKKMRAHFYGAALFQAAMATVIKQLDDRPINVLFEEYLPDEYKFLSGGADYSGEYELDFDLREEDAGFAFTDARPKRSIPKKKSMLAKKKKKKIKPKKK